MSHRECQRRSRSACGFTLVEVLVALAILVGVITGTAQLAAMAIRTNLRAATITTSVMLAHNKLEEILADLAGDPVPSPPGTLARTIAAWSDVVDGTGRTVNAPTASDRDYVRRWAIEPLVSSGTVVVHVVVVRRDVRVAMVAARSAKGR
jgi:prepilin-type N-terminal cleavage/methylation domain-containing protein